MGYETRIDVTADYVRAEVTGTRRLGDAAADAAESGKQIVTACRGSGLNRVLVILGLEGRLSAVDSYEIVTNSAEYGWSHDFKLALVNGDAASFDDSLFTETIAVNRAYTVKVFAVEADALTWLLACPG